MLHGRLWIHNDFDETQSNAATTASYENWIHLCERHNRNDSSSTTSIPKSTIISARIPSQRKLVAASALLSQSFQSNQMIPTIEQFFFICTPSHSVRNMWMCACGCGCMRVCVRRERILLIFLLTSFRPCVGNIDISSVTTYSNRTVWVSPYITWKYSQSNSLKAKSNDEQTVSLECPSIYRFPLIIKEGEEK